MNFGLFPVAFNNIPIGLSLRFPVSAFTRPDGEETVVTGADRTGPVRTVETVTVAAVRTWTVGRAGFGRRGFLHGRAVAARAVVCAKQYSVVVVMCVTPPSRTSGSNYRARSPDISKARLRFIFPMFTALDGVGQ